MRALLTFTLLAAAIATPALALTISPAPNRDQAQHLKQERAPGGGVDLRDSLAGGGRPMAGAGYSQGPAYGQTVTYGFGTVTTTVRTERQDLRPTTFGPRTFFGDPSFIQPELVPRRR